MAKKTTKKKTKKTASRSKSGKNGAPTNASGKQLVIVESPAKARTINKYLGPGYIVQASVGHVRDLPKSNPKGVKDPVPGVDLDHDFAPTYEAIKGKGKTITDLKRTAKQASGVWLATDLDREGEAIAWHLAEALGIKVDDSKRVVFNAITKDEIRRAFDHPRPLDMEKVNAQQARRILDRIVGYQVSPLLWKKVAGGLSAGRVQSVAVRLVVERELEIRAFVPVEYWKIGAYFTVDTANADKFGQAWRKWLDEAPEKRNNRPVNGRTQREKYAWLADHQGLVGELVEVDGKKFEATDTDAALTIAKAAGFDLTDRIETTDAKAKGPAHNRVKLVGTPAADLDWKIKSVQVKRTKSRPNAPFITSSLQVAAANQLGFAAANTMRLAQQLYEGIELGPEGAVGLITYMRTDSTHLSGEALGAARDYITKNYGKDYLPEKPNFYSSSNRDAQEAHEAIRPTDVRLSPNDPQINKALGEQQLKLYRLIWRRFVACQMTAAQWDTTTFHVAAAGRDGKALVFRGNGRTLVFDGFYKAAGAPNPEDDPILPPLTEGQAVGPLQIDPTQNFTSPPPRYSEASLVKKLESEGIGRPSTYAQIIQTIQNRNYVEKISGRFQATDLGEVVTAKLTEAFPKIMDIGYTRWMESELDAVEEQHHDWVEFLHKFYSPFKESLKQAHEDLGHAKAEIQPSDHKCPECDADCVYRFGKNGRFLSCSRYPDCKYAAPIDREGNPQTPEQTDIACPECGKAMIRRTGRFGPFLSCADYPECKGIVNLDAKKGFVKHPTTPPLTTDVPCPKCESPLYLRESKRGLWMSCSTFPKCRGRAGFAKLDEDKQKELEVAWKNHVKANPVAKVHRVDGTVVGDEYIPQVASDDSQADHDNADALNDSEAA